MTKPTRTQRLALQSLAAAPLVEQIDATSPWRAGVRLVHQGTVQVLLRHGWVTRRVVDMGDATARGRKIEYRITDAGRAVLEPPAG